MLTLVFEQVVMNAVPLTTLEHVVMHAVPLNHACLIRDSHWLQCTAHRAADAIACSDFFLRHCWAACQHSAVCHCMLCCFQATKEHAVDLGEDEQLQHFDKHSAVQIAKHAHAANFQRFTQ